MSRSYHRVYPAIWDEPWDDDTRYVALYLLTCEHRRTEGLYRLRWPYVMADLGWPEERVRPAWDALVAHGFIEYDQAAGVVWIRKAIERQPPDNANQVKAVVKAVRDLPASPLVDRFQQLARTVHEGFAKPFPEGFGDPPPPPPPTTEQQQERASVPPEILHPKLHEVVAILDDPTLGLNVEPASVDRILKANEDLDPIAAAHTVASWATEEDEPLRMRAANRLLGKAFEHQGRRQAQVRQLRTAANPRRQETHEERVARLEADAARALEAERHLEARS